MSISWTDKLTNDAVLLKADTQRSLLKVIASRQIRFLGHVLRKNELEAIALTAKIEGKRARGRQRNMFLNFRLSIYKNNNNAPASGGLRL